MRIAAPATYPENAAAGVQPEWERIGLQKRLAVLDTICREIANNARELAAAVPQEQPGVLFRSISDTMAVEVLPLIEAMRYLIREGASVLRDRHEPFYRTPFWMGRTAVVTRRIPLGIVLVIAAGNYPLYLPGVQTMQALAAGNAVLWKPAPGTSAVATAMRDICERCGLPKHVVSILDEKPEAAIAAIRAGVDKVFFTGSDRTGSAVLRELADTVTPSVMELSGCDAVFVLSDADLGRAAAAIAFALRLNGSATCMAPRRLIVAEPLADELLQRLLQRLSSMAPVPIPASTAATLRTMIDEAARAGAELLLNGFAKVPEGYAAPSVLSGVKPDMRIARSDIFAPVLSVMRVRSEEEAVALNAECPYSLSCSIFGRSRSAERFAARLGSGTILINDCVVASADPRAAFGGRKRSGFGTTRGREGLLEMTAVQTVITQTSRSVRAYSPTNANHADFFSGWLRAIYGHTLRQRGGGLFRMLRCARRLGIQD